VKWPFLAACPGLHEIFRNISPLSMHYPSILGLIYPLAVTALSQLLFSTQSYGSVVTIDNQVRGSYLCAQPFSDPRYFHPRPSSAGTGYEASQSSGSNLAPTNHQLQDRITTAATQLRAENPTAPIPIDLLTPSGSGLDPDITPAAAQFQIPRIAQVRHIPESTLGTLIDQHTQPRQLGLLGEARINVLDLNQSLDKNFPL
jgi:K+-transporting ATPase ATPase C chain